MLKLATTILLLAIDTLQSEVLLVPEQAPPQPVNILPGFALAVKTTIVSWVYAAWQTAPQFISV
jgi:hypothetical protein